MKQFTFTLGSIPVRIHPSFLLVSAMLGAGGRVTLMGLVQWVLVVFVGVLLHELGHALVGQSFGLSPQIALEGMGGLTSWGGSRGRTLTTLRSVAVSLAGPFTGIAIGLLARLYRDTHMASLSPGQYSLLEDVIWVNLGWGVLNLLPVLPLDGGNVLRAVLLRATRANGERLARQASIGVAVLVAAVAVVTHNYFGALMLAYFAYFNYQALQGNALGQ